MVVSAFSIGLGITESVNGHLGSEFKTAVLGVETLPIDRVFLLEHFYLFLVLLIFFDGLSHDLGLSIRVLFEQIVQLVQFHSVQGAVKHCNCFAVAHLIEQGILVAKKVTFPIGLEDETVLSVQGHPSRVDHVDVLTDVAWHVDCVILLECDLAGNLDNAPDKLIVCGVSQHLDSFDKAAKLAVEDFLTQGDGQLLHQGFLVDLRVQLQVVVDEELADLVLKLLVLLIQLCLLRKIFKSFEFVLEKKR